MQWLVSFFVNESEIYIKKQQLQDYWHVRKLCDWLSLRAYISKRQYDHWQETVEEQLVDNNSPMNEGMISYAILTDLTFRGKHNLISLTAPQWLARILLNDSDRLRHICPISFKKKRIYALFIKQILRFYAFFIK